MHPTLSTEEQAVVDENAAYVTGMYDLYANDDDILAAMRSKGIPEKLIPYILQKIKEPAYLKRLQQARRNIFVGGSMTILFTALYIFFIHLPDAHTLMNDTSPGSTAAIISLRLYRQIFYLFYIAAVVQLLTGIHQYSRYKSLLQQELAVNKSE